MIHKMGAVRQIGQRVIQRVVLYLLLSQFSFGNIAGNSLDGDQFAVFINSATVYLKRNMLAFFA